MSSSGFEFQTSQNVTIKYEVADIGERIVATILDGLFKIGYLLAIVFLIGVLDRQMSDRYAWIIIVFILPIYFYTPVFEYFMQGQTPGKKIRKIKVVKLDGSPASLGAYLLRWLMRVVDMPFFGVIGIITISLNKKGQRVGDIVAQTTVIKVLDRVSLKDTLYQKINSDYQPKYPQAQKLDVEDIELIKKVLNNAEYRNNFEMVFNLTNKIQAKMDVMRDEGPEDFLEVVVKDYNAMADR